jgi:hypothetical protein
VVTCPLMLTSDGGLTRTPTPPLSTRAVVRCQPDGVTSTIIRKVSLPNAMATSGENS